MTLLEFASSGPVTYGEAGGGSSLQLMHSIDGSLKTYEEQYRAFVGSQRIIGCDSPGFTGSDPLLLSSLLSHHFLSLKCARP